jgi:3-oxoacyl-[acyl-carrier-protein] synthase-3
MLDALRDKLKLPSEKFVIELEDTGNTVSSSIPMVLERCVADNRLRAGMRVLLVGFGVGYSWGAATVTWSNTAIGEAT